MYNFNLNTNEELKEVFKDILIKLGDIEKTTTIALTNKRLLFLEYINNDPDEVLRISRGVNYIKYKEVYYELNLEDINVMNANGNFLVLLNNECIFEFDDLNLYKKITNK